VAENNSKTGLQTELKPTALATAEAHLKRRG